jgi:hypothetical protein
MVRTRAKKRRKSSAWHRDYWTYDDWHGNRLQRPQTAHESHRLCRWTLIAVRGENLTSPPAEPVATIHFTVTTLLP